MIFFSEKYYYNWNNVLTLNPIIWNYASERPTINYQSLSIMIGLQGKKKDEKKNETSLREPQLKTLPKPYLTLH